MAITNRASRVATKETPALWARQESSSSRHALNKLTTCFRTKRETLGKVFAVSFTKELLFEIIYYFLRNIDALFLL